MDIGVIGVGYVGLVVGTCLAESGNQVICADIDKKKISLLKKGKSPIYEPGLEELIKRNLKENRLQFTTNLKNAITKSTIIFIAVGTPSDENGNADLSAVYNVAHTIGKYINGYKIVVDKSTVPVGTADEVEKIIRKYTDKDFDVISNPEFLKEGAAVNDFMKPDRIIIGTSNPRVALIMKQLYAPFVRTGAPILIMDRKSAEIAKYAANCLLATRISFMNEIANLCEKVGADVNMVRIGIGSDKRIGHSFLFAGLGYGGSCFPKDVKALARTYEKYGLDGLIVKAVDKVNTLQKTVLIPKILEYFKNNLKNISLAIWGLSFKPRTDDIREAPSIEIIKGLLKLGIKKLKLYDPEAMENMKKIYPPSSRILYTKDNYQAARGTNGIVLITEWDEFRNPDFKRLAKIMKTRVIFDGRNIYSGEQLKVGGFHYFGIGVPPIV